MDESTPSLRKQRENARDLTRVPPKPPRAFRPSDSRVIARPARALRVFDYLAHIDALQGDGVRDLAGNTTGGRASSLFGLEHDHRKPVLPTVGPCPVTGDEPGSRGNSRHNLLAQLCLSLLDITDRHPHDYRVHDAPSDVD